MPPSINDRKRKQNGHFISNKCKKSVDNFLRISQNANVELNRELMGKNVTQPKGDSIQVENRSNNYKKNMWLPLHVML